MISVVVALSSLIGGLALFYAVAPWVTGKLIRLLFAPHYGFRVTGTENLPKTGPVLVVVNHATWIDGCFLAAIFPRRARALVNAGFLRNPLLRAFAIRAGIIPVPFTGPKAQRAAIQSARETLDAGEVLVIFPEGQLTRTGFLGPLYRGIEVIMKGKDGIPIVPVYLDNLWGSRLGFSPRRGDPRRPSRFRRVIGIHFGEALRGPVDLFRTRQAMQEASVAPVAARLGGPEIPETVDPTLPSWTHPELGPLTASAPDWNKNGIHQTGTREGTVGPPFPGVAIRAVDPAGEPCPAETVGRLHAKVAGKGADWHDLGRSGSIDPDGFVRLVDPS